MKYFKGNLIHSNYSFFMILLFSNFLESHSELYERSYGILKSRILDIEESHKFCYVYYPPLTDITSKEEDVKFAPIYSDHLYDLCTESASPDKVLGKVTLAILDGNCSIVNRSQGVEAVGGVGTLFVGTEAPFTVNGSNITASFGLISNATYTYLLEQSENGTVEVGSYSSVEGPQFLNYNLIIIWILAEFSVIVGAFWSGVTRHRIYLSEQGIPVSHYVNEPIEGARELYPKETSSLSLNTKIIFILVLLMCVMLVVLWFLLEYVVYIIIALFCLASFIAVYSCLESIVLKIPCGRCRTPYFNLYLIKGVLEVRQILLMLFSLSLPSIWFFFRKEPHAWILQDILGIAFSINIMRMVRLPNLMICTWLLSLLVIYDIFFVFITPFITPSGTSIMVDVAQGGNSDEQLPMVLKVPLFFYPEYFDICKIRNYSILGFGDILVPGLLISYVHAFDLRVGTPCRLYFLVNVIAYGFGLMVTFLVLYLMRGAQPALFYLVPATLIPTVVIAAARGELSAMWKDRPLREKTNSEVTDEHSRGFPNRVGSIHSGSRLDDSSVATPNQSIYRGMSAHESHPESPSLGQISSTEALNKDDDSD